MKYGKNETRPQYPTLFGSQALFGAFLTGLMPIIIDGHLDELAKQHHFDHFLTILGQTLNPPQVIDWASFKHFLHDNAQSPEGLHYALAPLLHTLVIGRLLQPPTPPKIPSLDSVEKIQEYPQAFLSAVQKADPIIRFLFNECDYYLCDEHHAQHFSFCPVIAEKLQTAKNALRDSASHDNTMLRYTHIKTIIDWFCAEGYNHYQTLLHKITSPGGPFIAHLLGSYWHVNVIGTIAEPNASNEKFTYQTPRHFHYVDEIPEAVFQSKFTDLQQRILITRHLVSSIHHGKTRKFNGINKEHLSIVLNGFTDSALQNIQNLKNQYQPTNGTWKLSADLQVAHKTTLSSLIQRGALTQVEGGFQFKKNMSAQEFLYRIKLMPSHSTVIELLTQYMTPDRTVALQLSQANAWQCMPLKKMQVLMLKHISPAAITPNNLTDKAAQQPPSKKIKLRVPSQARRPSILLPNTGVFKQLSRPDAPKPINPALLKNTALICLKELTSPQCKNIYAGLPLLRTFCALFDFIYEHERIPSDFNWVHLLEPIKPLPASVLKFIKAYQQQILQAMLNGLLRYRAPFTELFKLHAQSFDKILTEAGKNKMLKLYQHLASAQINAFDITIDINNVRQYQNVDISIFHLDKGFCIQPAVDLIALQNMIPFLKAINHYKEYLIACTEVVEKLTNTVSRASTVVDPNSLTPIPMNVTTSVEYNPNTGDKVFHM